MNDLALELVYTLVKVEFKEIICTGAAEKESGTNARETVHRPTRRWSQLKCGPETADLPG